AHTVRPDVALEAFVLLALLAFRRLGPEPRGDLLAGAAVGAATAIKFTGVLLVPSYLLARGLAPGPRLRRVPLGGGGPGPGGARDALRAAARPLLPRGRAHPDGCPLQATARGPVVHAADRLLPRRPALVLRTIGGLVAPGRARPRLAGVAKLGTADHPSLHHA